MKQDTSKQVTVNVGSPVVGLLGVAFVVLKLTGYIAWSWWWVTAPFWIPLAFDLFVMAFIALCVVLKAVR